MDTTKKIQPPLMGGVYVLYLHLGGDLFRELGRSQWGPFWTEMYHKAQEVYGDENISYEFHKIEKVPA